MSRNKGQGEASRYESVALVGLLAQWKPLIRTRYFIMRRDPRVVSIPTSIVPSKAEPPPRSMSQSGCTILSSTIFLCAEPLQVNGTDVPGGLPAFLIRHERAPADHISEVELPREPIATEHLLDDDFLIQLILRQGPTLIYVTE
ncbi:hypothetical protein NMY22_g5704 [Coprinellus aureogranulatus]|nr:hypothetical protein NMY22_g5704 [Coprinellus aureogranulatus]